MASKYDGIATAATLALKVLQDAAHLSTPGVVEGPEVPSGNGPRNELAKTLAKDLVGLLVWARRNRVPLVERLVEEVVALGAEEEA